MEPLERRIRQRAFRIWVEEGHPVGKDREHWERAKAQVLAFEPTLPEGDAGYEPARAGQGSDRH